MSEIDLDALENRARYVINGFDGEHGIMVSTHTILRLIDRVRRAADAERERDEARELANESRWKCGANAYGIEPGDCDYPFCGCDPGAGRVIEALQECGWLSSNEAHSLNKEVHELMDALTAARALIAEMRSGLEFAHAALEGVRESLMVDMGAKRMPLLDREIDRARTLLQQEDANG